MGQSSLTHLIGHPPCGAGIPSFSSLPDTDQLLTVRPFPRLALLGAAWRWELGDETKDDPCATLHLTVQLEPGDCDLFSGP